ncbi:ABC transporter ATP-binding protein [Nocardia sp. NPDC058499]|uniref:ABC transporter ATP-binding protein n=1 Tax=Nocardia sp. NPDC058499 TaxID=3346530 RepID=UPI00365563F2
MTITGNTNPAGHASASATRSAKLAFRGVGMRFRARGHELTALSPIDLEVAEGEFLSLVGPSGCGKSTLLMLAAGLQEPTEGEILLNGQPLSGPGPDRSVVFQQFALFPAKTVKGNVEFGLRMARLPRQEIGERVNEALDMVGLAGFAGSYPHELSGGMQQRVALARALVVRPDVLLMDEPLGALDAQTKVLIQEELSTLVRELELTVLMVTHSVEEAVYLSDRCVVLTARPGAIKEEFSLEAGRAWRSTGVDESMADPAFAELHRKIWHSVRAELGSLR